MSTERKKGCWRGVDPDEQIEAALMDGLSEDRSGIDWKACVINIRWLSYSTSKLGDFGEFWGGPSGFLARAGG
jgi:hypothetical protein